MTSSNGPARESVLAERRPPIEIGRVLGETFGLMRERAVAVFGLAFLVTIPPRLLLFYLGTKGLLPSRSGFDASASANLGLVLIALSCVDAIMAVLGQGALAGIALQRRDGAPSNLSAALVPAIRRLPLMIVVSLLYIVGFMLGFVLLIVPGLMLLTMWAVIGPVLVAERTGVFETFGRSQDLTRHTRRRIFLLLVVAGIGSGGFTWLVQKIGNLFLTHDAIAMAYATEPAPFLFVTLLSTLVHAFNLAMACALYIVLIDRHGDGPVTERLNRIFE